MQQSRFQMCNNLGLPNSDRFAPGRRGIQHEDSWVIKSWLLCPRSLCYLLAFLKRSILEAHRSYHIQRFEHDFCSDTGNRHEIRRTWWAHIGWTSLQAMSQGQHSLLPVGAIPVLRHLWGLLWGSQELEIWKKFHCQMPLSHWANTLGKDDPLTSLTEKPWASSGSFPTGNCFIFQHPENHHSPTSHPSSLRECTKTTNDFSL